MIIKERIDIVEKYQCKGCIKGNGFGNCYTSSYDSISCNSHKTETFEFLVGNIHPGLPIGFREFGEQKKLKINIYTEYNDLYNIKRIPLWKFLHENKNTIVKSITPENNNISIDIFIKNVMNDIKNCYEVNTEFINNIFLF